MRFYVLLFIAAHLLGFAATETRHAKANILLYFYYRLEIAAGKTEDQRRIGVKCARAQEFPQEGRTKAGRGKPPNWKCVPRPGKTEVEYLHCKSIVNEGGTPCTLLEFLSHISGNQRDGRSLFYDGGNTHTWQKYVIRGGYGQQSSMDFDVDHTADRMKTLGIAAETEDVAPYAMFKNGRNFYHAKGAADKHINIVVSGLNKKKKAELAHIISQLGITATAVSDDRKVDATNNLEHKLQASGYEITIRRFEGSQIIDEAKTIEASGNLHPSIKEKVMAVLQKIADDHRNEAATKDHVKVQTDFEQIGAKFSNMAVCKPKPKKR